MKCRQKLEPQGMIFNANLFSALKHTTIALLFPYNRKMRLFASVCVKALNTASMHGNGSGNKRKRYPHKSICCVV